MNTARNVLFPLKTKVYLARKEDPNATEKGCRFVGRGSGHERMRQKSRVGRHFSCSHQQVRCCSRVVSGKHWLKASLNSGLQCLWRTRCWDRRVSLISGPLVFGYPVCVARVKNNNTQRPVGKETICDISRRNTETQKAWVQRILNCRIKMETFVIFSGKTNY